MRQVFCGFSLQAMSQYTDDRLLADGEPAERMVRKRSEGGVLQCQANEPARDRFARAGVSAAIRR